jgi:hypothetical protein
LDITPTDGADPNEVADQIFEYLVNAEDEDLPLVGSVDGVGWKLT